MKNKHACILIQISLNFVLKGPIDNKSVLVKVPVLLSYSFVPNRW